MQRGSIHKRIMIDMKVIYNSITPPKGFIAINVFGVLFLRKGTILIERTIRHEAIHTRQMKYMLYMFFYLWYGIEWCIRFIQYRDSKSAYYNISFEREAYANDHNTEYLKCRKPYSWVKYLKKKK